MYNFFNRNALEQTSWKFEVCRNEKSPHFFFLLFNSAWKKLRNFQHLKLSIVISSIQKVVCVHGSNKSITSGIKVEEKSSCRLAQNDVTSKSKSISMIKIFEAMLQAKMLSNTDAFVMCQQQKLCCNILGPFMQQQQQETQSLNKQHMHIRH